MGDQNELFTNKFLVVRFVGAIFGRTKKAPKQSSYGGLLYTFLRIWASCNGHGLALELMRLWNANEDRNNK